jgi:hypothetical protein
MPPKKPSMPDAANDPRMSRFANAREAAKHYLKALDAYRLSREEVPMAD